MVKNMKFKNLLVRSIFIFILCSLCHFTYSTFPNFFTSIFAPVNESIFEHLKMLFTAEILFSIIIMVKEKDNNKYLRALLRGYISIFILLLLYLPIYYFLGEIMILTFIILFVTIFLTEYILTFLGKKKHHPYLNIASVFLIIITYMLFTFLTYHPIKEKLFWDSENKKYGIDILNK